MDDNSSIEPNLTPEESEAIKGKSRWLRRVANPFIDLYIIIAVGAAGSPTATEIQSREDKQTRDHAKNLTPIQHKVYTEDFNEITEHIPFLKRRLESNDSSEVLQTIIDKVQSIAAQGRQSDTKTAKTAIVTLIPQKFLPPDRNGNVAVNVHHALNIKNPCTTKTWRGWGSVITARLLCPIDHLAEFKLDPEGTREKLRDGKLALIDSNGDPKLPAFLYDEDVVDGSLAQGLFRGPLLLSVYILIFISPTAATTGTKASSKRGNAQIHCMENVLPSTICYTAIQTYIALCCVREWKDDWKGVNFPRLYMLLREQFVHPDDPWSSETLKWWNTQVFKTPLRTDEDDSELVRDVGPSVRGRMEDERRERMEAAAASN